MSIRRLLPHPPQPTAPGVRLLDLDELQALPDPEWLIEGILGVGSFAVLYGSPGAGKSFLGVDWGLSIAAASAWLGRATKPGVVVYIAAEGGRGIKRRVSAWRQEHGVLPPSTLPHLFLTLPRPLDVLNELHVSGLIHAIQGRAGEGTVALVIIDTLARCMGHGNESATEDMNLFVQGCDRIRDALDCTVVAVHHPDKQERRERGSVALRGAADTMLRLTAPKASNGAKLVRLTLSMEKQKDDDLCPDIPLRRRVVTLADGKTSCVLDPVGGSAADAQVAAAVPATGQPGAKAVLALLALARAETPMRNCDWERASGLAPRTFQNVLKGLCEGGLVEHVGAEDRSPYRLTEAGTATAKKTATFMNPALPLPAATATTPLGVAGCSVAASRQALEGSGPWR